MNSEPSFMETLGGLSARHSLDKTQTAALLGVPVFTLRHWQAGTRYPRRTVGAAVGSTVGPVTPNRRSCRSCRPLVIHARGVFLLCSVCRSHQVGAALPLSPVLCARCTRS